MNVGKLLIGIFLGVFFALFWYLISYFQGNDLGMYIAFGTIYSAVMMGGLDRDY
jgi:hypothetical protein